MPVAAENQSQNASARFPDIYETAPFAIFEIDYNRQRFKCVNQAMCKLTGYTEQELLSINPADLLDSDNAKHFKNLKRELAGQIIGNSIEFKVKTKDGKHAWEILQVKPTYRDGKLDSALIIGFDITERKKAEEALRASEEKYRLLFNSIDEGFCIIEVVFDTNYKPIDYRFLEVNSVFEKQTGLHDAAGKLMRSMAPAHEEHWFRIYGEIALSGKSRRFEDEAKALNHYYDVFAFPLGKKKPYQVGILFKDIAEHKKAEEALKESEERLKMAQQVARVGTFEWNIQTGVNKWTPELEAMYGLSPSSFPGTQDAWEQLVYFKDRAKATRQVSEAMEKGAFEGEWRVVWPDGSMHWILGRAWVFKDSTGKPLRLLGINLDITERRKAEDALKKYAKELEKTQEKLELQSAQNEEYATNMEVLAEERARKLRDAERLAAIGATAGMVGHDIRNPLQSIVGDIYLLNDFLADLPEGKMKQEVRESLDNISDNINYINKIVADLQDYARPILPEIKTVNLKDVARTCFNTIVIPDEINLSVDVDATLWLRTDETLLRRIISNLMINAVQAMPNGGLISIKACIENEKVSFTVEDNGMGIPESVKPKLFTPMMTTKPKGQGLGLAVVKRLVEALNGTIRFESQECKGTKFIIELPINFL
jgi:PAS domain S-box-containing protein